MCGHLTGHSTKNDKKLFFGKYITIETLKRIENL